MPTTNPRINVTLSPSLDHLVARMASHQRVSKAQVLRELLEAAEPALQRAVLLMDAAAEASAEVRHGMRHGLDRAMGKAERSAAGLLRQFEATTDDLVAAAEAVKGRRPARPGRTATPARQAGPGAGAVGQDPPPSKRGVRSHPRGQEKVYSALNPVTGQRELLPVGKCFGRDGTVVDSKPIRRRAAR